MRRPADAVHRFDGTERAVHWWTAALVGACAATALALSVAPIATVVGRRPLVENVHVVSGLLLPVPYVLGRFGKWGRGLRADLRELDRFDAHDRRWLRSLGRDPFAIASGKFNPGQKVNAAVVAGALVLLFITGLVLRWFEPFPLWTRRGATFVHDWVAFLLAIDLLGHIGKAFADPGSLGGMTRGWVSASWARRQHPRWLTPRAEASPDPSPAGPSPSAARTDRSSR